MNIDNDGIAYPANCTIVVDDISVDFEIFTDRRAGIRERILTRNATGRIEVNALKDVSFQVSEGESVGLMGLNGSGKSTLLASIAGLLPVSRGKVLVSAEPRLMGVGVSLLGQLTGRQNLRLGCLALGMSSDQAGEAVPKLIEFSELGDAVDRPFRTYSSGMKARIQFAVATALTPKILLIDEGLSVGDKNFRAKSRQRVEEIISAAGTFVLVNHSLAELRQFCERGIWLDSGRVVLDGPIDEVIAAYSAST